MPARSARFPWTSMALITLLLAIFAAFYIQFFSSSTGHHRSTGCASNLRSLLQSQFNYAAHYGRPDGAFPDETGIDFWLKLQRTPKPIIDRYEPFFCPASGETPGPGRCSYRGPAFPIRTMAPEDPFAADKEGNHGKGEGGNVITKTGDVGWCDETDPLWIRARTTTKE
jgi:hypothetical protein